MAQESSACCTHACLPGQGTVLFSAERLRQAIDTRTQVKLRCCLTSLFIPSRSNDAFDATTGVDGDKPESVVNLTGNRGGVLALANAFLAAGGLLLWRSVSAAVRLGNALHDVSLPTVSMV